MLEAIVRSPPLLIRNDAVHWSRSWTTDALIIGVEPFIESVGRAEFLNHAMAWGGTGWVDAEEMRLRGRLTNPGMNPLHNTCGVIVTLAAGGGRARPRAASAEASAEASRTHGERID